MAGEIIIETKDLTRAYGEKVAVNHLNLKIRKGEVFGLLGPNGAGKTTTILMLLGLTEPTLGSAAIEGMDCTRNSIHVKQITGYLPDNVGFYPDMTGRENLRFTGKLNGLDEKTINERIEKLLARVGMTEAADRKTSTYSRGMRQRLGIADVLMKDPQVIIMDEPTLGLDPAGMQEFLHLIRQMAVEDGRTVLVSSHQLHQIQQICDRVGIFVEGNLIACGPIRELAKTLVKEGHYKLELQAEPMDDRLLAFLGRMIGVTSITKEADNFLIESSRDLRHEITEFMGKNGYTVLHMRGRGGDLDEIYNSYFEAAEKKEEEAKENGESSESSGKHHRHFGKKRV